MKILKKYPIIWITLLVVLVAVSLLVWYLAGQKKPTAELPEGPTVEPVVQIEMTLVTLDFPEALVGNIRHVGVSQDNVTMEIFYMLGKTGERELYRLVFGNINMGTHVGYLTTENGEVPVSVLFVEYAETFEEEDRILYGRLTDAFSTMMNSLSEDPRFSETERVMPIGFREAKLKYWTVAIPENVQFEESGQGEGYRAEFFGIADGKRVPLYALLLGNAENPDTVLGYYTVDGKKLELSIITYDFGAYDNWTEESKAIIYNMMSSINTVIDTIVEDENYSARESRN